MSLNVGRALIRSQQKQQNGKWACNGVIANYRIMLAMLALKSVSLNHIKRICLYTVLETITANQSINVHETGQDKRY